MRSRKSRVLVQRAAVVAAGSLIAVLAVAVPAFAHVGITPSSAPAGSAAELTFRVPDEEVTAATVELQVKIPTGHPIAQLLVKPVPGWTASVTTIALAQPIATDDGTFDSAVSEVTWRGGKILPGQFQDFSVSADPLPSAIGELVFKAIQTYSNGDVVRWIDLTQPGEPAPEHPAPVLTLTAGPSADSGDAGGTAVASGTDGSAGDDVTVAILLGAAGFAAGLGGLVAGFTAWRARRRGNRP
jgi:uncharacterized protein YcnI